MERRHLVNGFTSDHHTNNQSPQMAEKDEVEGEEQQMKEDKISRTVYPTSLSSSKDEYGSEYSSYNSLDQARMNAYLDLVNRLQNNLEDVHPDVDDEMASEEKRIETFNQWPKESPVKPIDLVKAGFYYSGPGDRVSCFSCDLQLRGWVEGDNPLEEHKRLKPKCIFILETERENYAVTCHGEPVSSEVTQGSNPLRQLPTTRPYIDMQYKEQSFSSYNPSVMNSGYVDPRFQTPYTAPYMSRVNPSIQSQQAEAALQERYLQQEHLNRYRDPRSLVTQESSSNTSEQFISAAGNSLSYYNPRPSYTGYPPVNYQGSISQNWYPRQPHPYLQTPDQFMAASRPSEPQVPHTRFPGINDPRFTSVTQESLAPAPGHAGHLYLPHTQNSGIPVLHPMPSEGPRVRIEDTLHISSPTDLQSEHHRMTTFVDWPENCPVRPWELASAGFYYLGNQDNVKCYKCAVMLRNWEPHDTPWEEHKRWSPDCPLVIAHYKGKHTYRPVEDQEQVSMRIPGPTSQAKEQTYLKSAQPKRTQFEHQERNTKWFQQVGMASSAGAQQSTYPSYSSSHQQGRTPQDYRRTFHRGQENTSTTNQYIPHVPEQAPWKQVQVEEILSVNENRTSPPLNTVSQVPVISSASMPTAQSSAQSSRQAVPNPFQIPSTEVSSCETSGSEGLSSSDVMRAMEMGFTRDAIDEAIAIRTQRTGNGFTNLGDLMQALLDNQNSTSCAQQTAGTCRTDPEPHIIERNEENMDQREAQLNVGLVHSISYHQDPATGSKQVLKRSNSAPPGSATNTGTLSTSVRELERTQEERLICKICMDAEVGIVFLPCGHISCCPNCASGLDLCPMCRNPIEKVYRTFLS